MFLPYYFAVNFSVPPFFTHDAITKGFLNLKLYKQTIPPSMIRKTVKWPKDQTEKLCSELYVTGKEIISCAKIVHVM